LTENEKFELARVINDTGLVLRRYFYQCLFAADEEECLPALTPPQVEMIVAIHSQGSMTVKQLAQVLCVKAPSVSTRVERLVEMGLLTREENPADRREVLVRISPKESAFIGELERRKFQAGVDLIEKLGMDHALMWQAVCNRIQEVLDGTGYGGKKECARGAAAPDASESKTTEHAG
jgi:DNA-binding MarR family transcriptional regulator